MSKVRAIIFDYYGVLLANTHNQRLLKLWSDDPDKAEEFSAVNRAADRGILTQEESRMRMAELMGISYERLLREYADGEVPNEPLIEFIEKNLKPRYKIGLLSNSTGREQLDVRFAPGRLDRIFDVVVSSGEIGWIKPQPEAYEYAAMKLGVLPEECVMVDDVELYCQGAEDVGMHSVHFTLYDKAVADLSRLLDETSIKV